MPNDVDAFLIRSLPELDEAAARLTALSDEIGALMDAEIQHWIDRNNYDWVGNAEYFGPAEEAWLAPKGWIIPGRTDQRCYLFFRLGYSQADVEDYWNVTMLTGTGRQRFGFELNYNGVGKRTFDRLWREHLARSPANAGQKPELFFSFTVDREVLATSVANGTVTEALGPLRDALQNLERLASELQPLKKAIMAEAEKGKAPA